jgi:hypothetical protein
MYKSLSDDQIAEMNRQNDAEHARQHEDFANNYKVARCYLCGERFDCIVGQPCIHWLLRQGKFKKKDFPKVYEKFGYHQIAAYLRWVANAEAMQRNINDLTAEKAERKIISNTIKWKNVEWTFDCTNNDRDGHAGTHMDFPHYHFQTRIDGRQFINFNDFHVPFSKLDLFYLAASKKPGFHQDFGYGGSGMQDAMALEPETVIEHTSPTDDMDDAQYHLQTMIVADENPISGDEINEIVMEARRTNKSFAYVAAKRLKGRASIQTVVSPAESIPDIAARTENKSR